VICDLKHSVASLTSVLGRTGSMIGYWHHPVVCPSVCNAVHRGSQARCTGLKVVSACFLAGKFVFVLSDTPAIARRFALTVKMVKIGVHLRKLSQK